MIEQSYTVLEEHENIFLSLIDVEEALDHDKPTLVLTQLEKSFLMLCNPKDAKNAEIVPLKRGETVEIHYAVKLRPYTRELLKALVPKFHIIIYSDDFWDNLSNLAAIIESKDKFFTFIFGREQML